MIGEPPEWAFWAILALLAFLMLLPMLKALAASPSGRSRSRGAYTRRRQRPTYRLRPDLREYAFPQLDVWRHRMSMASGDLRAEQPSPDMTGECPKTTR